MNKQITDKTPLTVLVKRKKAFTLVELIVVIAIVGILAAVLIPSITGYINNARLSNDKQLVSNLNDRLEIHEIDNKKPQTFHDALTVVEKFGFTTDKIKATSKNNDIVWDITKNRFSLIDGDSNVIFAESNKRHLWKIYNEIPTSSEYSIYLAGTYLTGVVNATSVGVDVGNNQNPELIVNYTSDDTSDVGQDVVIRTNDGILLIYAPKDHVTHFGTASYVEIINVASSSDKFYKESGISAITRVQKGRYIFNPEHNYEDEKIFIGSDEVIIAVDEKIAKVSIAVDRDSEVSNFTYQIVTKTETNPTVNQDVKIGITKQEIAEYDTVTYLEEPESPLPDGIKQKLQDVAFSDNRIAKEEIANMLPDSLKVKNFALKISDENVNVLGDIIYVALDKESIDFVIDDFESYDPNNLVIYKKITWTVSDTNVLSVENNKFVLHASGETTINAKSETGLKKVWTVKVSEIIGFQLNAGSTVIGNNFELLSRYSPLDNSFQMTFSTIKSFNNVKHDESVTWESSDPSIASISEDGLVTILKDGVVDITVTFNKYPNLTRKFTIIAKKLINEYFNFKFEHTNDFIYKIGNKNDIDIMNFINIVATEGDFTIDYTILNAEDNSLLSIDTPLSVTKQGSTGHVYKFNGTGVIKVKYSVFDDIYLNGNPILVDERILVLEVIDAYNVTTEAELRANSTSNRVILNPINIAQFSISISNATLHGNGFTLDATGVTIGTTNQNVFILNNGRIDNIVLEGLKVPYNNYTTTSNPDGAPVGGYNIYGIYVSGNKSYISNSYVSGFRAPIRIYSATNVIIENTVIKGGTFANVIVENQCNLLLRDVTTIQTIDTAINKLGNQVQFIGMGIVYNTFGDETRIAIEGNFRQYNWIGQSEINTLPSDLQTMANNILSQNQFNDFRHSINGKQYINAGIVFPGVAKNGKHFIDNRSQTEKQNVNYSISPSITVNVLGMSATGTVISYNSNNSTIKNDGVNSAGRFTHTTEYSPSKNVLTSPVLSIDSDTDIYLVYNETEGNFSTAVFDITSLKVKKYSGFDDYIKYDFLLNNDNVVIVNNKITFSSDLVGVNKLTFNVLDNVIFDVTGNLVVVPVEYTFEVVINVILQGLPDAQIILPESINTFYAQTAQTGSTFADPDFYYGFFAVEGIVIKDMVNGRFIDVFNNGETIPEGLTITVTSLNGVFKTYDNKTVFINHKDGATDWPEDKTVTVTYSYTGNNGKTVSVSKTATWNPGTYTKSLFGLGKGVMNWKKVTPSYMNSSIK